MPHSGQRKLYPCTVFCAICGGGGNDTIKGLEGNDVLRGEANTDTLFSGAGNDTLEGGTGVDIGDFLGSPVGITASLLDGTATGDGSDTLVGLEKLFGTDKDGTLTGNNANNTLTGRGGNDTLSGLGGNDNVDPKDGNDTVRGGAGNDTVSGNKGVDQLFGNDDDDTVNSKNRVIGNDSLDGGAHINGDTAVTEATEQSITGFP
jgi:Ca2+-binding RTX toxin-like protein